MMISPEDWTDFKEQGISLPKTTHGGKRPGAGRKPRKDGRKLRTIKVALSGGEFETIKQLSTDQRREAMIDLVVTLMVDQSLANARAQN